MGKHFFDFEDGDFAFSISDIWQWILTVTL